MGSILDTVAVVLGLLGGLSVAGVWARGKFRQSSASVWRDNAEAQRERGDRLEIEVSDLHAEVSRLHQKVEVLTEMVTGANAIAELGTKMDARFDALQAVFRGRS